jgi:hypothetical protein
MLAQQGLGSTHGGLVSKVASFPSFLGSLGARVRWALSAVAAVTAIGTYSGEAKADWGTCQPYVIYEIGLRNFQVTCRPGGNTVWLMYSTTDNDQANRFQSLMMAAVLSGQYVRADLYTDTGTGGLCVGISQTCRRATKWSLSNVPNP